MNTPANWFDAIFVINLSRRTDRWEQSKEELSKMGLNPAERSWIYNQRTASRFDAYADLKDETGKVNGNLGCTASHRAVLELIAYHRYNRALVLEDDFMLRPAIKDFAKTFDAITRELPDDYRMLYLGGSYAENPKRRHSPHLIEANGVMTTSSYVIGWGQARYMAPHISGIGPIDCLYHRFNREGGCFMAYPRLFVQRPGLSDLTGRVDENVTSMEDESHEDMLLEGTWSTPPAPIGIFSGKIHRREITAPDQLDGTKVIVDGVLYEVLNIGLPPHRPTWFRGEPCSYTLRIV